MAASYLDAWGILQVGLVMRPMELVKACFGGLIRDTNWTSRVN